MVNAPQERQLTIEEFIQDSNGFLANARGVVHIGANAGQERDIYGALGLSVVWVEALPDVYRQLCEHVACYPDQKAFSYLLTDEDGTEYDFGIANNGGQSSSIFDFADHKEIWPEVGYTGSIKLKSRTFQTMAESEGLDLSAYDALVMDVQGAELLVLKGMGDLVDGFKWIRCEAADFEIYAGCCQLKDLDDYLLPRGFERVKAWRCAGKPDLGYAYEALYQRKGVTGEAPTNRFGWLAGRARNRYSQFGEDGIIEAIFEKIGAANRWCVECGAVDGLFFSNTRKLIEEGWNSLQIEGDPKQAEKLAERYENWDHDDGDVYVVQQYVTDFEDIFPGFLVPRDLDLLVIDVDGQDYHLWNRLLNYQPRVVVCEFDPAADADFIPEIGGPGLSGVNAIIKLGVGKLYTPVCKTWCNVVFVRNDLAHLVEDEAFAAEVSGEKQLVKVAAVASTPRLGFLTHADCVLQALAPFQIPLLRGEGAYWSQTLTRAIERALQLPVDYVLTLDYDTVFNQSDVARLVLALHDNPEYDIAVSMQQQREGGYLLATTDGEVNMNQSLVPITRGQFALTLIRRSVFEKLALPWFKETPGPDGRWNEGRIDADIGFWQNCIESGVKVGLAMDVVVGHLELMITWPNLDRLPHYQHVNAWRESQMAPPAEAFSRARLVERAIAAQEPEKALAAALNMGD